MSSKHRILIAAAAAALLAAPIGAIAQPQDYQSDSMSAPSPSDSSMSGQPVNPPPSAMPAESAGVNTSGQTLPASAMSPEQAQALQNGDNSLVTNGPIPDTPANRARYGGPRSRGGRLTAPAGN
ncbi:MAG: hypothetical protein ACYC8V_06050 [Caulobacteraceae bacterium]